MSRRVEGPGMLTPAEVAELFHVTPYTVTRWAEAGKLKRIRTPGGTSRYFRDEIEALLRGERR